ncbi:DNA mismatch repair protein [Sphingobacterium alkalisoli]|uniref:DNA mismatch repair protein n=1 Tax=Sphingobacterium alkalisoli TaxID=1874115 RepID=A0A4U0H4Z5_9SPHI|nr:DNA mismatch repair protein [Sphingobacterium alkalisoli]TJY66791.1 DNA mismatch repair protein [Sphingobacterium alkalisoli]GGH14198.1 DNA mismatch repair protein MutS [Sphingobacterium alkalisoli]
MSLLIDKQTLDDLGIFAQRGKESIFSIFNKTATSGGSELLEEWFTYPLSDGIQIQERIDTIQYFMTTPFPFPFQSTWFDQALFYLDMADERSRLQQGERSLKQRVQSLLGADTEYKKIVAGIIACSAIIHSWKEVLQQSNAAANSSYARQLHKLAKKMKGSAIDSFPLLGEKQKLTREQVVQFDTVLRFEEKDLFMRMLRDIYTLDVYLCAAGIARERNFNLPKVNTSGDEKLAYENVWHPLVPEARGNDLQMDKSKNITFLTGANMAGKSTFMKSLGISLFLAHIGFPVPAQKLVFTPRDAIYTSINLPDNIQMGYSHFYAEVLRIKKVAQQLAEGKRLFVVFDEMFRGTNVKDAFEGTVAVVSQLYQHPGCQFVISTHILEAGEQLASQFTDIQFVYLPTVMRSGIPSYTYVLQRGITADRHGMIIIENEGIIDLLNRQKSTHV